MPTNDAAPPKGRHYGMDWLRIGAFALLILYHIGMFFVPWGWHVKTAEPLQWATLPMLATNSWRIPLLFVVSGYASAALFAKSPGVGGFARNRSARLLVPLVAGVVLFVPPQPWVELTFKHGYSESFGWFWLRDYFRFGTLEEIVLPTWNHLWFVVYLWLYTMGLAVILLLPRAWREWGRGRFDRLLGGAGVLLVPLALLAVRLLLGWPTPGETHDVVGDLYAHTLQFPLFLFGFLLRDAPAIWRGVRRWWSVAAILSLIGYAAVVWVEFTWPGETRAPDWASRLFGLARNLQMWGAIVALIGIADRFWNSDHPRRAMLTEAVFPFYIIHQTIIVVVGWYLLRFAMPAGAEFAILLGTTVVGCWLFYLVGRAIMPLRPLIGLRAGRPRRSRQAQLTPHVGGLASSRSGAGSSEVANGSPDSPAT